MQEQLILVLGNPVDGYTFVGPFTDQEAAVDAAVSQKQEWTIAELQPPESGHWHVNVYERDRAYGGPEEGGWWFDTGRYRPEKSVTLDRSEYSPEQANAYALAVQDRLNAESDAAGIPPVGYTQYHGGRYLVQTDDKPGADWPAERPYYS